VLCCLLVHHSEWLTTLDKLIKIRSRLRLAFGVPARKELKGNHFATGKGAFSGLEIPPRKRIWIYRKIMLYQARQLKVTTFAIAVDKAAAHAKGWEPRDSAWTKAIERINRFCQFNKDQAMLFPDAGHGYFIRKKTRAMRRFHNVSSFYGGDALKFAITNIIEDPNERASHDSYFVQLADLNAYAAHRSSYLDPKPDVDSDLWDCLGPTLLTAVNRLRSKREPQPPAIVTCP